MKTLLKNAREAKGIKTRELAQLSGIDQALISKFESGARRPTKKQILKLSEILEIDPNPLLLLWVKEKILDEINGEPQALEALKLAGDELNSENANQAASSELQNLLSEFDALKAKLDKAIKG